MRDGLADECKTTHWNMRRFRYARMHADFIIYLFPAWITSSLNGSCDEQRFAYE
jgi:hypothetical protein